MNASAQPKRDEAGRSTRPGARGALPAPLAGSRPSFTAALTAPGREPLAVIAEYKRASPSRGVICEDLEVEDVAAAYHAAGAAALSILTEQAHFHGNLDYLARAAAPALYAGPRPPLLRKDFLCDPLQVRATAATPAAAHFCSLCGSPRTWPCCAACGSWPKAAAWKP